MGELGDDPIIVATIFDQFLETLIWVLGLFAIFVIVVLGKWLEAMWPVWRARRKFKIPKLEDVSKADVYLNAISAIKQIGPGDESAMPALVNALWNSRRACQDAADALARIGPAGIPALIEALSASESRVRAAAAQSLAESPFCFLATQNLLGLLGDSDSRVSFEATKCFAKMGPRVIPHLLEVLSLKVPWEVNTFEYVRAVRVNAISALAQMGPAAAPAIAVLVMLLRHSDDDVCASAAEALGCIAPGIESDRRAPMEGSNERGLIPPPPPLSEPSPTASVIPALIEILKASNRRVAAAAAKALGEFGPRAASAVPSLVETLHHGRDELVSNAAETLGRIGPAAVPAIPTLIGLLEPGIPAEPAVTFAAAVALGKIGPTAVPGLIEVLKESYGPPLRKAAAARSLAIIGPAAASAVPALIEALKGASHKAPIGSEGEENGILRDAYLKEEGEKAEFRRTAVWAVACIGPTAASGVIPAITEALKDPRQDVRASAAEALEHISRPAALATPDLIDAMKERDSALAGKAEESVHRVGGFPRKM